MRDIKVGYIYTCLVQFKIQGKMRTKQRPVLVIGKADFSDLVTLPISKISKPEYRSVEYDIEVMQGNYPKLNLTCDSYVRTHKTFTADCASIYKEVCDLKNEYPDLYKSIISKYEQFVNKVIVEA